MVGHRRSHAKKRDENEGPIVDALRRIGAKVYLLDGKGGIPDLIVGFQGRTVLMEVKQEWTPRIRTNRNAGRGGLDPDQFDFHQGWTGGPCVVVTTVDEALAAAQRRTA